MTHLDIVDSGIQLSTAECRFKTRRFTSTSVDMDSFFTSTVCCDLVLSFDLLTVSFTEIDQAIYEILQ